MSDAFAVASYLAEKCGVEGVKRTDSPGNFEFERIICAGLARLIDLLEDKK